MSSFLTADWCKLIMAQYEVASATLAPWLPRGVELDLYQGRCYVSLVGFLFDRVRVKGLAIPFHTRFEEVNLRFYVKRPMANGAFRRGVVFVSEIVPRAAITLVANALYGEAYRTTAMRHVWRESPAGLDIGYSWRIPSVWGNGRWQHLSVHAEPQSIAIAPASREEFITEHYWGYTGRGNGTTSEYGVEHPHWQVYPVRSVQVSADFAALYRKAFAHLTGREPDHVLLAEGSAIAVRQGSRIPANDIPAR